MGKHLIAHADKEETLKPYTIEEIHAMVAESERQIAAGQYQDFDEAMDEIEAVLAREKEQETSVGSLARKARG